MGLDGDAGFYHDFLDFGEERVVVDTDTFIIFPKRRKRPLRPFSISLNTPHIGVYIRLIGGRTLIHTVIREVRKPHFYGLFAEFILLSSKPHKSFLVHIDPERVKRSDAHIHSQVVLQSIDSVRVSDVARVQEPAEWRLLALFHRRGGGNQLYPASAGAGDWLSDPEGVGGVLPLCFKAHKVVWEDERLRADFVLAAEAPFHPVHVPPQVVLPAELPRAWKVVRLLVLIQAQQKLWLWRTANEDVEATTVRLREPVVAECVQEAVIGVHCFGHTEGQRTAVVVFVWEVVDPRSTSVRFHALRRIVEKDGGRSAHENRL